MSKGQTVSSSFKNGFGNVLGTTLGVIVVSLAISYGVKYFKGGSTVVVVPKPLPEDHPDKL